jgi:hypothetical protein
MRYGIAATNPIEAVASWQRDAGLDPRRPIRLITAPGAGIQAATRPVG